MKENLGVAVRAKPMTGALELPSQFPVVVDLAVLDDVDVSILACDGLVARFEVDDREPSGRERNRAVHVFAEAVGAAMGEGGAHRGEAVEIRLAARRRDPADPAHGAESRDLPERGISLGARSPDEECGEPCSQPPQHSFPMHTARFSRPRS